MLTVKAEQFTQTSSFNLRNPETILLTILEIKKKKKRHTGCHTCPRSQRHFGF